LADAPSALDLPIHPDLGLLAQCGRGFFAKLTRRRLKRAIFRSIADLQAVNAYLAEHNASPEPFVWTGSAESILAKLHRCPVLSF
jgi:hypothetical protein